MRSDDEPDFRLRPPKPKARRERSAWAAGFKRLMHHARASRGTAGSGSTGGNRTTRPHFQRCIVRAVYANNRTSGQWRAHGRYIARESAAVSLMDRDAGKKVGFNAKTDGVDIATELERWQSARDPLVWKLIVSPEFGERADLPKLTRDMITRMEDELGTSLEWVAVVHHNTGHPHVHIAIRGVRSNGEKLRLNPSFVKQGIRSLAENLCTQQLGYRTERDALDAERREITERRFTSLDRYIQRVAISYAPDGLTFQRPPLEPHRIFAHVRAQHAVGRLKFLESMGLASTTGPNTWELQRDFDSVLRAMQRTSDRQRILAAHGLVPSDPRLPIRQLNWNEHPDGVTGRILVHGQDESSGRGYLMLEGTNASIHYVPYTPEMESARSQGGLRTNSFVKLRRLFGNDGKSIVDIQDRGNADALLNKQSYFSDEARKLIHQGITPTEDGWGGWLGKYQAKLRQATGQVGLAKTNERDLKRKRRLSLER